jgi:hypothetical protein
MSTTLRARADRSPRTRLRLYRESEPDARATVWRINGYRARLHIWTLDEWENLEAAPADAQYHPSGVWCALRLE